MASFVSFLVRRFRSRTFATLVLLALAPGAGSSAADKPLLGPVEELQVLDDFTTASQSAWKTSAGQNVLSKLESGLNIPGVAESLMLVELTKKTSRDTEPG